MAEWSSPISVKSLGKGVYRVMVAENKFNQLPDDRKKLLVDRIIMIGSTERNLPRRIGEFLEAASGRNVRHREGKRFYEKRSEHGLDISDLEIEFKACECPICEENREFMEFYKRTGSKTPKTPYLCENKPPICSKHGAG